MRLKDWFITGVIISMSVLLVVFTLTTCKNVEKVALEEVSNYTQMECKIIGYVGKYKTTPVYFCVHKERQACFYVTKYLGDGVAMMNAAPCHTDSFEKE